MVAAFSSVNTGGGYPQNTITIAHTLSAASGTDRIVFGCVTAVGSPTHTVQQFTYNSVNMTLLQQVVSPAIFGRVVTTTVYYLLDAALPAAGTYNFEYRLSSAYGSSASVCCYTGVRQVVPPFATGGDAGNPALSGLFTTNITVLSASGLLLSLAGLEGTATITGTPASPATERADYNGATIYTHFVSDKAYAAAGANSMGWTPSGTYWDYAHLIAELEDASAPSALVDNAALLGASF